MLILDLRGISFHAVVVVGLGKDLLFKSVLGHCAMEVNPITTKGQMIPTKLLIAAPRIFRPSGGST